MSDVVFVLGAGASKQAGVPVMVEFLDVAHKLSRTGQVKDSAESFDLVFKAIGSLQSVHSKSELDIQNVESVFAAFEMGKLLKRFPDPNTDMDRLIHAMKTLITKTIENTLRFPASNGRMRSQVLPPQPYKQFVDLLVKLMKEAKPQQSVAVITFNYDMGLDYACKVKGVPVDYALSEATRNALPILKLHGSLNWAVCSKCSAIVPWTLKEYLQKYDWSDAVGWATMPIGTQLRNFQHCAVCVEPEPVIIPPTWNKGGYHKTIEKVWARAAKELSEAESIFVAGYSLPESDHFFRFLYSLGSQGTTLLKRFWVFDPDESVEARFESLLGPGARARFEYFSTRFEEAIQIIWSEVH